MLLEALLEAHAWASARPRHENSFVAQSIEQKIASVMEAEKQQGMYPSRVCPSFPSVLGRHRFFRTCFLIVSIRRETSLTGCSQSYRLLPSDLAHLLDSSEKTRQQLNQFITQIKTALAALTGLGL
jgi:hypothetical protein